MKHDKEHLVFILYYTMSTYNLKNKGIEGTIN